jgi:hypothetical protein
MAPQPPTDAKRPRARWGAWDFAIVAAAGGVLALSIIVLVWLLRG